jgi:hypothetical protein
VFTSLRHFRDDLIAHPPDHFVCVPLVLDTLYNKVGDTQAGAADFAHSCALQRITLHCVPASILCVTAHQHVQLLDW